jgi:hypothetical protein
VCGVSQAENARPLESVRLDSTSDNQHTDSQSPARHRDRVVVAEPVVFRLVVAVVVAVVVFD